MKTGTTLLQRSTEGKRRSGKRKEEKAEVRGGSSGGVGTGRARIR